MTLDYSQTLDALLGWIGSPTRATVNDSNGDPLLVLNGELGRAPDSDEDPNGETRFFCVGHDDPREGADGFFLPAASFRHGMFTDPPLGVEPGSVLFVAFEGGASLVIEREPVHGRSSARLGERDLREVAGQLDSSLSHLFRYEDGSAKDSNGELASARLLIERARDRLEGDG